jgi:selenocysteine lyase/cysteine desulfurase
MPAFDVDALRAEFPPSPASRTAARRVPRRAGRTQVPQRVIDAVTAYLPRHERQLGGAFTTSHASPTR